MKAVIIAGGAGSRIEKVAKGMPKALLEIGGKPVLQHQIELLVKNGFKDILLLTSYKADQIEAYFGDGFRFGAHITYKIETTPLGTAGSLKAAEDLLKKEPYFLVMYGDIMLNMNLKALAAYNDCKQGIGTLAVHPNSHPYDSDLIELDYGNRIIAVHTKPHSSDIYYQNMVNAGVYMLSREIFKHIPNNTHLDFGRDIFPEIISKEHLYGYKTAEYIKDMGTPERLEQVREDYESGKIKMMHKDSPRPAIFLDRDGIINVDTGFVHTLDEFRMMPDATKAISKINEAGYLAIVVTNQPVIARGMCTIEEMNTIHKKMDTLLGKGGAFIDELFYCPHHPDKGFPEEVYELKVNCECRKPKAGMIEMARKMFNIDMSKSWVIGDTWRDMQLANNVGIRGMLVNQKGDIPPDIDHFESDGFAQAVETIIDYERDDK